MENNATYKQWMLHRKEVLAAATSGDNTWRYIRTAELLLHSPGLEVAARPWLYPRSSFADTDIRDRLSAVRLLPPNSQPSLRASFHRKLRSRCVDYAADFPSVCYLHDVALAKQLNQVVAIAALKRMAPDEIASGVNNLKHIGCTKRNGWKTCAARWIPCQTCFSQWRPLSGPSRCIMACYKLHPRQAVSVNTRPS